MSAHPKVIQFIYKTRVPKDYPVQPLKRGESCEDKATCETCGLSWDDGKVTSMTPVPSGRCPFESFHEDDEPEADAHMTAAK